MSPLTESTRLTLAKTSYPDIRNGIVTNGLVLNLDAGQTASYPGTGTTWTDLSGNGNNGTLVNGPTYSSANGGSLTFNGTNRYVQTASGVITITSSWTTNVWFKTTGSSAIGSLVVRGQGNEAVQWRCELQASTGKVNFVMRNSGDQAVLGVTPTNDDRWHLATYTKSGNVITIYLDGNRENSATLTNFAEISGSNVVIGRLGDSAGSYYFNGSIAQASLYNVALTAAEIQQNFNCLRMRYGI